MPGTVAAFLPWNRRQGMIPCSRVWRLQAEPASVREKISRKTFAAIVGTREYKVAATSVHLAHVWKSNNPLLGTYPGAIGIKTGFTSAAGQCLLFEARRGSKTLIGVVLDSSGINSPSLAAVASDAVTMLDWGFSH